MVVSELNFRREGRRGSEVGVQSGGGLAEEVIRDASEMGRQRKIPRSSPRLFCSNWDFGIEN